MTPAETRIAFTNEGVRSITEQRAFLKSQEKPRGIKNSESSPDYIINKGKVTFRHDVTLDVAGLAAILSQMTR
jgi:hypothetical protein